MQHDRPSGDSSQEVTLRVMQAKIDMLFDAFGEIKTTLKSVSETVGMFKLFDHQIKQQGIDLEKVEKQVQAANQRFEVLEKKLTDSIEDLGSDLEREIQDASKLAEETRSSVNTYLAYGKGVLAGFTFISAALYAILLWQGGKYVETIEDNDRFKQTMETLKLEEHLRDAMKEPPKDTATPKKLTAPVTITDPGHHSL